MDTIREDAFGQVGADLRVVTRYEGMAFETRMRDDVRAEYTAEEDRTVVDDTILGQLRLHDSENAFGADRLDGSVRVFDNAWVPSWPDALAGKSGVVVSIQRDGSRASMESIEWCIQYLDGEIDPLVDRIHQRSEPLSVWAEHGGTMGPDRPIRRRRLLLGAGAAGTAGLAGCATMSPFTQREFEQYACTDIDDEPTERYEPERADLPFGFEKPEPMARERVNDREDLTRLDLRFAWTQPGEGGAEPVTHQIFLRLLLVRTGEASREGYWDERPQRVVDEIQYGDETVRIASRDDDEGDPKVWLLIPSEGGNGTVYDPLSIAGSAALDGGQAEADERETDPDQTCREAVERVVMTAARSVEPT